MPDSEATQAKHSGLIPWQPGQSGNPAGRPLGARNKLGEAFIKALEADFSEHGVQAIQTVRAEKPDQYLKVIASLMPKEMTLNVNDTSDLTDDQLIERARGLAAFVGPFLGAAGIGVDAGGIEAPAANPRGKRVANRVH